MSISENIKKLRECYGISQKELAAIANVTDKAVSTWETGNNKPRMGAIQKIADYFHIKKSDIIEDFGWQNFNQNKLQNFDLDSLSPENREKALEYIKLLHMSEEQNLYKKKSKEETSSEISPDINESVKNAEAEYIKNVLNSAQKKKISSASNSIKEIETDEINFG